MILCSQTSAALPPISVYDHAHSDIYSKKCSPDNVADEETDKIILDHSYAHKIVQGKMPAASNLTMISKGSDTFKASNDVGVSDLASLIENVDLDMEFLAVAAQDVGDFQHFIDDVVSDVDVPVDDIVVGFFGNNCRSSRQVPTKSSCTHALSSSDPNCLFSCAGSTETRVSASVPYCVRTDIILSSVTSLDPVSHVTFSTNFPSSLMTSSSWLPIPTSESSSLKSNTDELVSEEALKSVVNWLERKLSQSEVEPNIQPSCHLDVVEDNAGNASVLAAHKTENETKILSQFQTKEVEDVVCCAQSTETKTKDSQSVDEAYHVEQTHELLSDFETKERRLVNEAVTTIKRKSEDIVDATLCGVANNNKRTKWSYDSEDVTETSTQRFKSLLKSTTNLKREDQNGHRCLDGLALLQSGLPADSISLMMEARFM